MAQVTRNDPCPCGSGKKYEKCCLDREDSPNSFEQSLHDFIELSKSGFLSDCFVAGHATSMLVDESKEEAIYVNLHTEEDFLFMAKEASYCLLCSTEPIGFAAVYENFETTPFLRCYNYYPKADRPILGDVAKQQDRSLSLMRK